MKLGALLAVGLVMLTGTDLAAETRRVADSAGRQVELPARVITRESLHEVYHVEVTVTEVARADGRVARVCVPSLGRAARGPESPPLRR
ncbi:MAG TPA: hypothetical protein VMS64_32560 [Candidatus Methylomirabilis sp.]|nr:hypothetical protein [Candidatus Methylomirabilis sp.]